MKVSERMLLRGLRDHISESSSVLSVEVGKSDALGPMRKVSVVLTSEELLLATPVRTRTVLTTIRRADIANVESWGPGRITVTFEDFDRAILLARRVPRPNL